VTEPQALPVVSRILPADVTDQAFMECMDDLDAEIRAMGVPFNLVRTGVMPQEDGTWLALGWQATGPYDWSFPTQ